MSSALGNASGFDGHDVEERAAQPGRFGPSLTATRRLRVLVSGGLLLGLLAAPGVGLVEAGNLSGSVRFEPNRLPKSPVRNQGFVERIENPLRPVKRIDPLPFFIVVLEGGPVADADREPTETVRYQLVGESFEVPLLPVVVGTQVELKNVGFGAPLLSTPEQPSLLEELVLDPRRVEAFRVDTAYQPVVIRAAGSAHLEGRVVAFPHRYFSRVDERGRFDISNVPPGEWRARIWYRDGWLAGADTTVQVGTKRSTVTLTASPVLTVEAP